MQKSKKIYFFQCFPLVSFFFIVMFLHIEKCISQIHLIYICICKWGFISIDVVLYVSIDVEWMILIIWLIVHTVDLASLRLRRRRGWRDESTNHLGTIKQRSYIAMKIIWSSEHSLSRMTFRMVCIIEHSSKAMDKSLICSNENFIQRMHTSTYQRHAYLNISKIS